MVKKKIVGAAGRFGARYGQHIKRKIADIESRQRKKQICPFCEGKVKRSSKGIWRCNKCNKKFTSHAYFIDPNNIKIHKTKVFKEQLASIKQEKKAKKEKPKEKTKKKPKKTEKKKSKKSNKKQAKKKTTKKRTKK
jgi:large subunit ribosomal protein L37Ae